MSGKKQPTKSLPVPNEDEDNEAEESEDKVVAETGQRKTYGINAILIDFFLYDTMKGLEAENNESIPHHRTRSIWY